MSKLFISGNRVLTVLGPSALASLEQFCAEHQVSQILVGDAAGVDWFIQSTIGDATRMTIYYSGKRPRHYRPGAQTQHIPVPSNSTLPWHQHKDRAMAEACDLHIGFIASFRPSGTLTNHERVQRLGKPSRIVYVAPR